MRRSGTEMAGLNPHFCEIAICFTHSARSISIIVTVTTKDENARYLRMLVAFVGRGASCHKCRALFACVFDI